MSYQAWRAQWNQAMEQLVLAYRAMAGTHENNTTSMLARDQAEGAKWGGYLRNLRDHCAFAPPGKTRHPANVDRLA
jgi:hypothetical protein